MDEFLKNVTWWQVGIREDGENTEAQPGKYIVKLAFDDPKTPQKWVEALMETWKKPPTTKQLEADQ